MHVRLDVAQKGIVLSPTRDAILASRYTTSHYLQNKLVGRRCLPGGRMHAGEDPDTACRRQIEADTGVRVRPLTPFYLWTWTYMRGQERCQMIGIARVALAVRMTIRDPLPKEETTISRAEWLPLHNLRIDEFVDDEQPALRIFFRYQKENPFVL